MLGQYADVGMNFVSGAPLNERNRVEVLIDDQGLYRETQVSTWSPNAFHREGRRCAQVQATFVSRSLWSMPFRQNNAP